jgi:hypothetical protein
MFLRCKAKQVLQKKNAVLDVVAICRTRHSQTVCNWCMCSIHLQINITAAGAVDRELLFILFPFDLLLGCHAPPLGSSGTPLGLFAHPWSCLWSSFGRLGAPLDSGSLWVTLGSLVDPFWKIIESDCPEGPKLTFNKFLQRNRRPRTHPWISRIPRISWLPRIGCHELPLGTSLLHTPGVRMTRVLNKLPQMIQKQTLHIQRYCCTYPIV